MSLFDIILREKRRNFDRLHRSQSTRTHYVDDGVFLIRDIRYHPGTGSDHVMDVFKPDDASRSFPSVLYLHGGGLAAGNREYCFKFCHNLAKQGYVVYSINYRLIPDVKIYDQVNDVSRAMDFVYRNSHVFGGDKTNTYMVGDGAGALLIVDAIAAQKNRDMARAFNVKPSKLDVKAVGFIDGMFYTTKMDKIGITMSNAIYGKHFRKRAVRKFTNPSSAEVCGNLPPCYLVTGRRDSLHRYTLEFYNALNENGVENKMSVFRKGDCRLTHAFPVFHPEYEESARVIKNMTEFFAEYSIGMR